MTQRLARRCGVPVAILLAAGGCTEAVSPGARPELATTAATAITLDQQNGSMNDVNTSVLLKGFNPTNPHRGDAVVVSFFWRGSTNIITSVIDHLANATPVGNTYTQV